MNWNDIEIRLKNDLLSIHRHLKNLAPQDTNYTGSMGQPLVFVNGNAVYGNTNNLFNSVDIKFEGEGFNKSIVATVFVDGNRVPYYERAVLYPELSVMNTFGKKDYGDKPVIIPNVTEQEWIDNRNYMYYMRGYNFVRNTIKAWDGQKFYITDTIENFR